MIVSEIESVDKEAVVQDTNFKKMRNHHCHIEVLLNKGCDKYSHTAS